MKHTDSQLTEMIKKLRPGNRTGHPGLDGLRWASSSIRLDRDGVVCQGHVAYGVRPGKPAGTPPVWLGIVCQGPRENCGQRYWVVYAGSSPVLASSEVSQKLYQRTLSGFDLLEPRNNHFNLMPSAQVEEELLDQIRCGSAPSFLEQVITR